MDPANYPAAPPPKGQQSNFKDPKTLKTSLIAINAVFLPLMLMVVAIRLYSRGHIMHALGWDDYTCVMAALGSLVYSIIMLWDIRYGYGRHLWDIRAITLLPSHLRVISSLMVIYPIVILLLKLSISLLYLRLFGAQRNFKLMVYSGIIFCSLFYLAFFGTQVGTVIICEDIQSGKRLLCAHSTDLLVISGVVNVVTDLYLLALPIPEVLKLQLKCRRKVGILAIFMTGLIASLVSLARLVFASVRLHDEDAVDNAALTTELTSIELNVGIITVSMSAMPQFFAKSPIFKFSTYNSLRLRMFTNRNRSKLSTSGHGFKQSKADDILKPGDILRPGHRYHELDDANQFRHPFDRERRSDGDDASTQEILKTIHYGVSTAEEPRNFTVRENYEKISSGHHAG